MTQITAAIIGPADHGRRMSLHDFDTAIGREGKLYELSRGAIVVSDVPNPPHARQLARKARQIFESAYSATALLPVDVGLVTRTTPSEGRPPL